MQGGVASSGGWVSLAENEYEKTFLLERYVEYLKIMWTSDMKSTSYVSIYLNDDLSPIFLDTDIDYCGDKGWTFSFIVKEISVFKFKVVFLEENPNRNVNFYGYY